MGILAQVPRHARAAMQSDPGIAIAAQPDDEDLEMAGQTLCQRGEELPAPRQSGNQDQWPTSSQPSARPPIPRRSGPAPDAPARSRLPMSNPSATSLLGAWCILEWRPFGAGFLTRRYRSMVRLLGCLAQCRIEALHFGLSTVHPKRTPRAHCRNASRLLKQRRNGAATRGAEMSISAPKSSNISAPKRESLRNTNQLLHSTQSLQNIPRPLRFSEIVFQHPGSMGSN